MPDYQLNPLHDQKMERKHNFSDDDHTQYVLADGTRPIQPTTDSTTAWQVLDQAGNTIVDIDSVNDRVGIGTASPKTTLDVNGSFATKTEVKTANYTVTDTDGVSHIEMTAGATDKTVSLPTLADNQGRIISMTLIDVAAGNAIFAGEGAEEILYNGQVMTTLTIWGRGDTVDLKAGTTYWMVI
jgi:hypothetical protein